MTPQQEQARTEAIRMVVEDDAAPGDLAAVLMPLRESLRGSPSASQSTASQSTAIVQATDAALVGLLGAVGPHRLTDADHPEPAPVVLTERFGGAVSLAAEVHHDQTRKATSIPYVAHLLGAASLLLEQPGVTEDQAIAALLHDVIEDQGDRLDLATIASRFGPTVARIVSDCTDADTLPKPPWAERKTAYIAHLQTVGRSSLQVSLADKLHNATAILRDRDAVGPQVWDRFSAPPAAQRWYYTSLAEVFSTRLGNQLSGTLARTVEAMFEGVEPPRPTGPFDRAP